MKEKCLSKEIIFSGKVVTLELAKVECYNEVISTREVLRHKGASAVLCVVDGKVLLERQYRYAYDDVLYEIPAGKIENNEDPYITALRELVEETGYKTDKLVSLGTLYPACGYSDEKLFLYYTDKIFLDKTNFDTDEYVEIEFVPLDQVLKMIDDDTIRDSKTIVAIHKYLRLNKED